MAGQPLLLIAMVIAGIQGMGLPPSEDIVDVVDAEQLADGTFRMPDSKKLQEAIQDYYDGKSDFLDNVVGEGIDLAKKGSELSDGEVIQETGTETVNGTQANVNTKISRNDMDGIVEYTANEVARHNGTVLANSTLNVVNGTAGMNIRYMDNAIYAEVGLQNNATVPGAKEYVADLLRGIAQDLGIDLSSIASDNAEGGD